MPQTEDGHLLTSAHLTNPALGLAMGILGTSLVQSSSTTTSLVVAMVASGTITVHQGIPVILGTNVGTSFTASVFALLKIQNPEEFRLGLTTAMLHDVFNWMTVLVLLPLERLTGFLSISSHLLVESIFNDSKTFNASHHISPLYIIEAGMVDRIVRLAPPSTKCNMANSTTQPTLDNPMVLEDVYEETEGVLDSCSILKTDCEGGCRYLFASTGLGDITIGAIIVICSIFIFLFSYLVIYRCIKIVINSNVKLGSNFLGGNIPHLPYLTDPLLFLGGALVTLVIQSSTAVTCGLVILVLVMSE